MRWGTEDFSEWEAKRMRWRRRRRLFKRLGVAAVFLASFGAAWKYLPPSMDLSHIYKQWAQERQDRKSWVYYRNCDEARRDGVASIHEGEPGYRPELDADSDGIACEPIPLWKR